MSGTTQDPQPRTASGSRYNLLVWGGAAVLVALAAAAVVLIVRGGGDSASVRHQARQATVVSTASRVTVDVVDNDFEPANLSVKRGATVVWQSKGKLPHTVTDDRGAFDSKPMKQGDVFEYTFDTPGTFYYYCIVHHIMTGSITVTE